MTAVMARSLSSSSVGGRRQHYDYDGQSPLPPWEQHTAAKVPHLNERSPPLTYAERQALPSLWASDDNGSKARGYSDHGRSYSHQDDNHCRMIKAPSTASHLTAPRPAPPLPKDHYKYLEGPKSTPRIPASVKAPPSPPVSRTLSCSSTKSSETKSGYNDVYRTSRPSVTALPGTMSTRERSPSRRRIGSSHRDEKGEKGENLTFGKRFKLAIKDIFKRDPVDESSFETIEDRHWTDD